MDGVFNVLAHQAQRDLLVLLRRQPMTAGDLAEALRMPRSTLSGHINALKSADLVYGERHGPSITYHLNLSVLEETMILLMNMFGLGRPKDQAADSDRATNAGAGHDE